ncbi:MAG: rhodanese-like domain-containing protein [Nitrospirota bacterium]
MKRSRYLLPVFLLILQIASAAPVLAAETVTAGQVRRWQADKKAFYLVDVRPKQVFLRKHIEGAINIPAFVVAKKGLARDKDIVLYDNGIGTVDAKEAADNLAAGGYGTVFLLDGGLARWEASNLPLQLQSGVLDTKLVELVTAAELARALHDSLPMVLVDLREPALFKSGSIPGAVHAAPANLLSLSSGWQKDGLIVLFDTGDAEAERQAEQLRRAGFKMVRYLYGGFPEWKK